MTVQLRVHLHAMRALRPKLAYLGVLGMFLLIVVSLYYYFLDRSVSVLIVGIPLVMVIFVIDAIIVYRRYSRYTYDFHEDHLETSTKKKLIIPYEQIRSVSYTRDMQDELHKTWTVVLRTKEKEYALTYLLADYAVYSRIVALVDSYQEHLMNIPVDDKKLTAFSNLLKPTTTDHPKPAVLQHSPFHEIKGAKIDYTVETPMEMTGSVKKKKTPKGIKKKSIKKKTMKKKR
ncbi:MAG: hypothetical protein V1725_02715 [archaeon]